MASRFYLEAHLYGPPTLLQGMLKSTRLGDGLQTCIRPVDEDCSLWP